MNAFGNVLAAATVAAVLTACSQAGRYSGDGQFTDNGWTNYSRRYVIDLGPVDLATPGVHAFALSGLPHAQFTVGLDVVENASTTVSGYSPTHAVRVRVELQTSQGDLAILEEGLLNSWVRSSAHGSENRARIYQRGKSKDVSFPSGATGSEHLGVKASGGWGTYFDADRDEEYRLTFEVLSSDVSASIPAKLTLVGWDRE